MCLMFGKQKCNTVRKNSLIETHMHADLRFIGLFSGCVKS